MDELRDTEAMDYYARPDSSLPSPPDSILADAIGYPTATATLTATATAAETETETATARHAMPSTQTCDPDPRTAIAAASPGPQTVRPRNAHAMCETDHRAMDCCA